MHTLPEPTRLTFVCSDRIGNHVTAEVVATQESGHKPWVWRAVFRETGQPPAELMGASEAAENIQADICARLSLLQVAGIIIPPADQGTTLARENAAAEVAGVLRTASAMAASDQRRANLNLVLKELAVEGIVGTTLAAQALGIRDAEFKAMLEGAPVSDAVARDIEWASHKPTGWMDGAHHFEPAP
jgi:hypothetical protein